MAEEKTESKKTDFTAPPEKLKLPADEPKQEAGSRAAIQGDLEEAPEPPGQGKTGGQ